MFMAAGGGREEERKKGTAEREMGMERESL